MNIKCVKHAVYQLFKSFSIIHRQFHILLVASLKDNDLMGAHPSVLTTIYMADGLNQEQLAKALRYNKGAISKIVKTLEANEFITRKQDSQDKRVYKLYVTEKGKGVLATLFEMERNLTPHIFENFSDEEISTFSKLLDKIIANTNKVNEALNARVIDTEKEYQCKTEKLKKLEKLIENN